MHTNRSVISIQPVHACERIQVPLSILPIHEMYKVNKTQKLNG